MQFNILFVDDEINVLNGFRRELYSLRNNWNGYYASSGNEALDILKNTSIDVCVVDFGMPHMNGKELLSRIKKNYPKMIRVLLSGYSNERVTLQTFNLAHQYFTKPCNFNLFKERIESALLLRELIKNEDTLKKLNSENGIPTLPEIYYKLEREINSLNPSIYRIVNIISKDIALTSKIFQLVNSAYFGIPATITDLYQAVNILGLNIIKSLIIYTKVFAILEEKKELKELIEPIWNHSILVSKFSQIITYHFTQKNDLAEQAFIAGILHDIGKVILLNLAIKNNNLLSVENITTATNDLETKEIFGATHYEISAYTLALWGFPRSIVEAVLLHHSAPADDNFTITTAVQISHRLANLEGIDSFLYTIFNSREAIINFINEQEWFKEKWMRKF